MRMNNNLLFDVIEYNKKRKIAFKNGEILEKNIEFERILSARYMKVSRLKKKIIYLMARHKYIYFCTFTFDDYYIKRSERTQKDLIKSSLYSFDSKIKFVLNVDYGKKNERLHYHGIIATDVSSDLREHLKIFYPCMSSCDSVPILSDDIKRLSKYINKLTNHALKDSTKSRRLLSNFLGYQRLSPSSEEQKIAYIKDCIFLGIC